MKTKPDYCPMTKDVKLTVPQRDHFCALGCSPKCPELLKTFIVKVDAEAKRKEAEAVYMKTYKNFGRRETD